MKLTLCLWQVTLVMLDSNANWGVRAAEQCAADQVVMSKRFLFDTQCKQRCIRSTRVLFYEALGWKQELCNPTPAPTSIPSSAPSPMPTADCFDEVYDIVIIGAGLAGIGAAYKLEEFIADTGIEVSYSILEADSQIGGRAVAALEMSGPENPLLQHVINEMGGTENTDYTLRDYESVEYFDNAGNVS